jgi:uncharacterized protein (TIGR02453 family)
MTSPHFSPFPEAGLRFLRRLKRNNNRNWFLAHKMEYEESVKKPMEELVRVLALEFPKFAPEAQASPRVSLYRISRDTRFSSNKTPYKTHVAAVFPWSGLGKHEGAGFYFHISTEELLIGGGLYMPLPEDLQVVRERIAGDPGELQAIVRQKRFRQFLGDLTGERLVRLPRGFPADHPAAEFLKFKQFLAARALRPEAATVPDFPKTLVETFKAVNPLVRFLNKPILENRKKRGREESLLSGSIR